MQSSWYHEGHFPLLSFPALHGSLSFLSFARRSNYPPYNPSRFWKGFQSCSYMHFFSFLKEAKEKQHKHRQTLEQFCDTKTRIYCNEHGMRFYGFNSKPSTYEETGIAFLFQSAASFQNRIFNDASRLLLWPKLCQSVKTCGHSTFVAMCLSFLMCSLPLCLIEDCVSAHEMLQRDLSHAVVVMDISQVQGKEMLTEAAAGERALAHASAIVSRAIPLFNLSENASLCEEAYGVFPCSNSVSGNLILMLVYGYLLLTAAKLISEGSELLLEVTNPGLVGGLLLPILGALPDAALICASGVGGTVEEAQQQVLVGVGVLAGSTSLILTIAWAGSLVAGRCDLSGPGETAKDLTLTRGFDLFRTGITTDEQTRWGALVMIASGAPYVCAQLPLLDRHPEQGPESALAGCIIALSGLVLYCSYQIASPWLQKKKIEEARLQFLRTSALHSIAAFSAKTMMPSAVFFQEQAAGPSEGVLQEIFASFDKNEDGRIQQDELRSLILGLNIDKGSFQDKEQVEKWLNEFDVNADGMLSEAEFFLGVKNWATRVAEQKKTHKFQQLRKSISRSDPKFWGAKLEEAKETLNLLEAELEQDDEIPAEGEAETSIMESSKIYQKSSLYLVSGAALAGIFSDPLINSIQGFSNASTIPSFFVAFVVVPFASNASELFSSLVFAMKKRKRSTSLTYSQIYGSVTMNNTLCLGIFLGLVYARGLTWDFSSEVTVVLMNIILIGLLGVSRSTFPLWYAIPVFSLYFASLGGVALLDNVLGWQ